MTTVKKKEPTEYPLGEVRSEKLRAKLRLWRKVKKWRKKRGSLFELQARKELAGRLGMEKIDAKQYKLLILVRDNVKVGDVVDYEKLALEAGYGKVQAHEMGIRLLSSVDDRLFEEILGVGKKDVFIELKKVLRQDDDLGMKVRAAETLAKITGLMEERGNKVEIKMAQGLKLAD